MKKKTQSLFLNSISYLNLNLVDTKVQSDTTPLQVLIPPKDLGGKLSKECEDYQTVLDQVKYRVDWAKYQEMQKRKEEEALERERGLLASPVLFNVLVAS